MNNWPYISTHFKCKICGDERIESFQNTADVFLCSKHYLLSLKHRELWKQLTERINSVEEMVKHIEGLK